MQFTVNERKIKCEDITSLIGDNADYAVTFAFDEEWEGQAKTARFILKNRYVDVILEDDACTIPVEILKQGVLAVGVYAEKITSTICEIPVKPSIKEKAGNVAAPTDDVYAQLLKQMQVLEQGAVSEERISLALSDFMEKDDTLMKKSEFNEQANAYLAKDSGLVKKLHLQYVTPQMFGAVGDGVTDDTEAIQNAIDFAENNNIYRVIFEKGSYVVTSMIYVPRKVSVYGSCSTIYAKTNDYVFGVNTRDGVTWVRSYDAICDNTLQDFMIENYDKSVYTEAKGICLGGATKIYNIKTWYLYKTIHQIAQYIDNKIISNITTWHGLSDEDIFLYLGDGLEMDRVFGAKTKLKDCAGGILSNFIGGSLAITYSRAVTVNNWHNEDSYGECSVSIIGSQATFNDCYFWKREDAPVFDIKQGTNLKGATVSINNTTIACLPLRKNLDRNIDDIVLDGYSSLYLNNTKRQLAENSGHCGFNSNLQINGTLIHPLYCESGTFISKNWQETKIVVRETQYYSNRYLNNLTAIEGSGSIYTEGTYYFKGYMLYDNVRMIAPIQNEGTTGYEDVEKEVTLTDGQGINIGLTGTVLPDGYIRLYRGINTSVYNYYVDIPTSSGMSDRIIDYNGESLYKLLPYVERTESGVDELYRTSWYELKPNGNVIVKGDSIPTCGTWTKGDIIKNENIAAGADIGWICIEGGTSGTWKSLGKIAE